MHRGTQGVVCHVAPELQQQAASAGAGKQVSSAE